MSTTTSRLSTIAAIKAANKAAGQFYFSPDTMRFFRSRVLSTVFPASDGAAYFVTSEQYDDASPRLYTVRKCSTDGTIATVGEFQQHETARAAKRTARDLAAA